MGMYLPKTLNYKMLCGSTNNIKEHTDTSEE